MRASVSHTAWIAISVVVFVVSWNYTSGGYSCSIPLALLLLAYTTTCSSNDLITSAKSMCKRRVFSLIKTEKRSLLLLTSYWSFVVVVSFWFPYLEESNGSPYSLIFFSVAFILLYIVPTLVGLLVLPIAMLLKWEGGLLYGEKSKSHTLAIFHIVWEQRITICVVSVVVLFMFLTDGDMTCVIRYTMKGEPCWPVLIPQSIHSTLPYPLQHAWIKSWHKHFIGYTPGIILVFIQNLGRELGEVPKLLPVLIGVYVVSLLLVPSKNTILRQSLFACVAGVVLGGITSGSFKILLHRYRPNAYGDPYKWTGPGTAVVNHLAFSKLDLSFPAGHTSVTSAVATCLCVALLQSVKVCSAIWKICIAILLYTFPVVVLVSRVGDCYHWTSDAAFGVSSSQNYVQHYNLGSTTFSLSFSLYHVSFLPSLSTSLSHASIRFYLDVLWV